MRRINRPWGYETIWAESSRYLAKIVAIMSGKHTVLQMHKIKDTTFLVQRGTVKIEHGTSKSDLKTTQLEAGQAWNVPSGTLYRFFAVTDVEMIEASSSEIADTVRFEEENVETK